jgi:uncharacterized protein (DUF952 family)
VTAPIFHIARAEDWESAQAAGSYRVSTLGRSLEEVGFIHCSFAHQVEGTARMIYADEADLVLLEIASASLHAEIRHESPDGSDDRFPHIYGPLNLDAVVSVKPFSPRGPS